jgi:phage shock protein C
MQVNRRLYRCRHDRRLAGVASGLAEYFDIDPSLMRLIWILTIFLGGTGLLVYIALAIIVPEEPEFAPQPGPWAPGSAPWGTAASATAAEPGSETGTETTGAGAGETPGAPSAPPPGTGWHTAPPTGGWYAAPSTHRHVSRGSGNGMTILGIVLILFGGLALVDALLPAWADGGRFLWPAFIVGVGALLVATAVRRRPTEP